LLADRTRKEPRPTLAPLPTSRREELDLLGGFVEADTSDDHREAAESNSPSRATKKMTAKK
jgi:hypothetical protein